MCQLLAAGETQVNSYQIAWSRPGHSPTRDSSKVSATRTLQRPEVRARLTYLRQEATKGEDDHAADLSPTGLRNLLDEVTGVLLTLQDAAARAGASPRQAQQIRAQTGIHASRVAKLHKKTDAPAPERAELDLSSALERLAYCTCNGLTDV